VTHLLPAKFFAGIHHPSSVIPPPSTGFLDLGMVVNGTNDTSTALMSAAIDFANGDDENGGGLINGYKLRSVVGTLSDKAITKTDKGLIISVILQLLTATPVILGPVANFQCGEIQAVMS